MKDLPLQKAKDSSNSSQVDVCIFIDPLFDFLSAEGVFCRSFGEDDCSPILSLRKSLNDLHCYLHNCCPSVDILIVSSVYEAMQFEAVHNLCTTRSGRKVLLDGCPVDESYPVCGKHVLVEKRDNSILSCSEKSLDNILALTANRNVLVCGVTTVSCVSAAVDALCGKLCCGKVMVARDGVSSRNSNAAREKELLERWISGGRVEVHEHWEKLLVSQPPIPL